LGLMKMLMLMGTYRQMMLLVDLFLGLDAAMEIIGSACSISMLQMLKLGLVRGQRHERRMVYRRVTTVLPQRQSQHYTMLYSQPSKTTSIETMGRWLNKG
jgi:hypothetical protein